MLFPSFPLLTVTAAVQSSPGRIEESTVSTVTEEQLAVLKGMEIKPTDRREEIKTGYTVVVIASAVIETVSLIAIQLLKYIPVPLLKEGAMSLHSIYKIGHAVYNLGRLYYRMYQIKNSNLQEDIKALALLKLKKDQADFYEDIILEIGKLGLRLCVLAVTVVIFMSMFTNPYGWLLAGGISVAAAALPSLYRFVRGLIYSPNSTKEIKAKIQFAWNKAAMFFLDKRFKVTKASYLFAAKWQLSTGEKINSIIAELSLKKAAFQKRKARAKDLKIQIRKAGVKDFKRRLLKVELDKFDQIREGVVLNAQEKEAFIKFFGVNREKWTERKPGDEQWQKKIDKFFGMATQDLLDATAVSFELYEDTNKALSDSSTGLPTPSTTAAAA